ncbi:MAG: TonB-dependent receptor domain-containing protein, partial [Bryobacteraceae bacterium]
RTRTIPDPALRTGNFAGLPVVVHDPDARAPFPGNVIPPSRLDPAALKFLELFPQPNAQGVFNSRYGIWANNWIRAAPQSDGKNFAILRVDYSPTDRDKIFATFSHVNEGPRDLVRDFTNVLNTTVGPRFRNIRRLTIGYTRFLRPNLTHELLASAQRDPRKIEPWYPDFDVTSQLGIRRKVGTTLPRISISGGYGSYGNSDYQNWVHQPASLYSSWTAISGRHTWKFGAQLYQNQFWYISASNLSGTYNFSGDVTGLGTAGLNNPVNALADLLLGAVKTASIQVSQIPLTRVNYNLGLYLNDDWKVSHRLSMNWGLRYEFETKQIVKNKVYSRVDLATGELLVAGRNASRNLNLNNDYLNFSPRLGLAYTLTPKTVVRAGAGVFHSNLWINNGEMVRYPGWTSSVSFVDQGLGRPQPFRLADGFPVDRVPAVADPLALAAAATERSPLSVAAVTYNPTDRIPYTFQWSLSVQRDVGFNTVLDLAYVANRGVKLPWSLPANNPRLENAPAIVLQRVPAQQLRPWPRYTAFSAMFYQGASHYHSLQAKATRRFSNGLSIDANYTFAKMIDTNSGVADSFQIPWQFARIERAVSSLDRTHVFNLGWVYELPFGRGRRFLSSHRVLGAVVGGFQLNGLMSAASGVPLTITQTNRNTVLSAQRPDVVDPGNLSGRVKEPYFQGPARRWLVAPGDPLFPFRPSSNIGIGNLGRNTSREPGFWNMNLSLFRQFRLREAWTLELRAEAFNFTNAVNFLEPSTNIDSATYGLSTAAAPARQVQLGARISF